MPKFRSFTKRVSRTYIDSSRRVKKRLPFRKPEISKSDLHPIHGHPLVLPVLVFISLFFITTIAMVAANGTTIGASDSRLVTVTVDGKDQTIPTRAKTVADLLRRLQIEVNEKDIVKPALDSRILEDNVKVVVQKARPVTIIDNGTVTTVLSAHQQIRTVVTQAGIVLYPEDGIETAVPETSQLTSGLSSQAIIGDQVVVDRASPAVINLYGNNIAVRTRANTVRELLEDKDIKTLPGDTIQPSIDTKITDNIQVFIVRVGKQIVTSEEAIPAPSVTIDDATLPAGSTVVKEAGSPGKKIVTYEIELQNGVETSRRAIQEVIAAEPVRTVIAKGTKVIVYGTRADWLAAVGISPSEYFAVDYIIGKESGWCPTKWQGEYGGCPAYHGTPTSSSVGYGLCQSTPGWKMAAAGADWATSPVTQLRWCTDYARRRYGSWTAAYNFWSVNRWW